MCYYVPIPSSLFQAFRWWEQDTVNHEQQTQKENKGEKMM